MQENLKIYVILSLEGNGFFIILCEYTGWRIVKLNPTPSASSKISLPSKIGAVSDADFPKQLLTYENYLVNRSSIQKCLRALRTALSDIDRIYIL